MERTDAIKKFAAGLRKLVMDAKNDNGKSFDDLAARIRARQADGLIEEAIGYLPEGLETPPQADAFKRIRHLEQKGVDMKDPQRKKIAARIIAQEQGRSEYKSYTRQRREFKTEN